MTYRLLWVLSVLAAFAWGFIEGRRDPLIEEIRYRRQWDRVKDE